jgi:hypothetical protein
VRCAQTCDSCGVGGARAHPCAFVISICSVVRTHQQIDRHAHRHRHRHAHAHTHTHIHMHMHIHTHTHTHTHTHRYQTYGPQSRPDEMRPVMWSIYMAGGYANWCVALTSRV